MSSAAVKSPNRLRQTVGDDRWLVALGNRCVALRQPARARGAAAEDFDEGVLEARLGRPGLGGEVADQVGVGLAFLHQKPHRITLDDAVEDALAVQHPAQQGPALVGFHRHAKHPALDPGRQVGRRAGE